MFVKVSVISCRSGACGAVLEGVCRNLNGDVLVLGHGYPTGLRLLRSKLALPGNRPLCAQHRPAGLLVVSTTTRMIMVVIELL